MQKNLWQIGSGMFLVSVVVGIAYLPPGGRQFATLGGLVLDVVGVYLLVVGSRIWEAEFSEHWPPQLRESRLFEPPCERPNLYGVACIFFGFLFQLGAALGALLHPSP